MFEINFDGTALERALLHAVAPDARRAAMAKAATRTAAAARAQIVRELPSIFRSPTPFTLRSPRYAPASPTDCTARVYISDDATRGLSPRKYLGPEIRGGGRNLKRSERALQIRGIMQPGQWLVPSDQAELDRYGNISGALLLKILSRIGGLTEAGYNGNVSENRKRQLKTAKLAVKSSGTEYFIARSKMGKEPLGIWRLRGPGQVEPVLIFANRAPDYHARFKFSELVERVVRENFNEELRRALLEGING